MLRLIGSRARALFGLAAALASGPPSAAWAHGFGQRYDLPLPLSLYLVGAAAAVVLTFVIVGLFVRHAPRRHAYPRLRLPPSIVTLIAHPALGVLLRLVTLILFAVTVLAGFIGNQNPYANIAPTLVWVILWVGFAYVSAFVGDLWALINPWRTVFDAAEWLFRRASGGGAPRAALRYPDRCGVWPACVLLLALSWVELVYPNPAAPRDIAWFAVAYSIVTWTGMALYGGDAWTRHGEVFNLVFGTFARFAPIETRAVGAAREWALRPFGAGLLAEETVSVSMMAFVLLLLATVLYDGALGTPEWASLEDAAAALLPRLGAETLAIRTVGLIGFWLVFLGAFVLVGAMMRWAVGGRRSARALAQDFALTLVPIVIGYHLAHYLLFLLVQGQYVVPLASDPFGFGWNLFGTAGYRVNIAVVGARFAWYTAVAAILMGHVIAVYLAHVKAIRLFGDHRVALRGQVPLTALMVAYTFVSLSILAEPIVEHRAAAPGGGEAEIVVPADAILPEPENGKLTPVGTGKVAREKLTYRMLGSAFQDGTRMTAADLLYAYSFAYRWSSEADGMAHYDPTIAAATAPMRQRLSGLRLAGIDTVSKSFRVGDFNFERELFIVEVYLDLPPQDPEQDAAYAPPWSTVPWTVIALMEEAVARGWAAFSQAQARRRGVEWLDLVRSGTLGPRLATLVEQFADQGYRPEELRPLVTVDEARKRWAALAVFHKEHGHFLVTNGPYVLKAWATDAVTLEAFRDLSYPLGVGSFDAYAVPRRGYVTKIERQGERIRISGDIETEMKFQRSFKLVRQPIASIPPEMVARSAPECRYMLLDGDGTVALAGHVLPDANAGFTVELGGGLPAGDYTLLAEIVVNGNAMNAEIQRLALSLP